MAGGIFIILNLVNKITNPSQMFIFYNGFETIISWICVPTCVLHTRNVTLDTNLDVLSQ